MRPDINVTYVHAHVSLQKCPDCAYVLHAVLVRTFCVGDRHSNSRANEILINDPLHVVILRCLAVRPSNQR